MHDVRHSLQNGSSCAFKQRGGASINRSQTAQDNCLFLYAMQLAQLETDGLLLGY